MAFRRMQWLFLLTLFLGGCAAPGPPAPAAPELDAKIGQMLMVGFRGLTLEADAAILRDIRRHHLGGVLLFDYDVLQKGARNVESPAQVEALVATLRQAATTPLLVAIDQEGGKIARLKERYGFPPTVSHTLLGRQNDPAATYEHSGRLAQTLADLRINLNLAPVVDLCANPDNPVIARHERCFSAEPQQVTEQALAFIAAHRERGVLTTLKHFPGHGSSRADSHLGFTDVTGSWSEAELAPFARLIAAGQVDAVMTAHVFNARLDGEFPATLSRPTITGLLREKLGFAGVVISDDLQMRAVTDLYGFETAVRRAIEAGVDILVVGNNLSYEEEVVPRAIALIRSLVQRGELSEARIDESYRRILQLKTRLEKGTLVSQRAAAL